MLQEVRLWMGFLRSAAGMLPAAVVILLASGLYMMVQSWSLRTPFVAVGLVTLLLMAGVGAGFVGRRLAAIGRAAGAETSGALTPDLAWLHAPATWIALSALNGSALGVLWIMTNKPGWAASIGIVAALAAVGGAIGWFMVRRPDRTQAGDKLVVSGAARRRRSR